MKLSVLCWVMALLAPVTAAPARRETDQGSPAVHEPAKGPPRRSPSKCPQVEHACHDLFQRVQDLSGGGKAKKADVDALRERAMKDEKCKKAIISCTGK
ncbi:hypothetical protein CDD83_5120 [Cordyceps sp. RAO-2017]|nr:hypothetical protein CDD83_5120 [Cordyceps sp. RAO-2017]